LNKLGIFLATQELRTVFDHFDLNKDNAISYAELINCLRNNMSEERMELVKQAWYHLAGKADSISAAEMQSKFRAAEHPRATSREKKPDVVMKEFCDGMSKYV